MADIVLMRGHKINKKRVVTTKRVSKWSGWLTSCKMASDALHLNPSRAVQKSYQSRDLQDGLSDQENPPLGRGPLRLVTGPNWRRFHQHCTLRLLLSTPSYTPLYHLLSHSSHSSQPPLSPSLMMSS